MKKYVGVLLLIALGVGCRGVKEQEKKTTSAPSEQSPPSTLPMGQVKYGEKVASVPLYLGTLTPKEEYFYSKLADIAGASFEVRIACVIDEATQRIKVVHYTSSCPIEKCTNEERTRGDNQFLGKGIPLHLDPDKEQLDCNGIQVQVPPHPATLGVK